VLGKPAAALLAKPTVTDTDLAGACRSGQTWSGPALLRYRNGHTVEMVLQVSPVAPTATVADDLCGQGVETLLDGPPRDDAALLLARTHPLDPRQVAMYTLAPDPSLVADVRAWAAQRLRLWGLEELQFSTELIVSELVTNAIRYGAAPIGLRLIHQDKLICEVSDGINTSPQLRHPDHGRGRPRTVPRRSAHQTVGGPLHRPGKDHLGGTGRWATGRNLTFGDS
jgi:hypothetical protein